VFLANCALHSGGLLFLWIVFHGSKAAMGMLLMRWSFVVFKDECSCDYEKDVRLQQNAPGLFLPPSAKVSKDEN
jgi:hypothetical protein